MSRDWTRTRTNADSLDFACFGIASGRQLFQSDKTLATSDQALGGDEDAVEVDISQYDRAGPREDEEEEEDVLLTYDSDS